MASLTGAGSTSTLQQNIPQKPKSSLLGKIKEKISLGANKVKTAISSPETKAIIPKALLSSPSAYIGKKLSEKAGQAGLYLVKSGEQAKDTKIPVISQMGSITKAAGNLLKTPEDTRQNVIQIKDNVKTGKITLADGILESGTSIGLAAISTAFAPYTVAIQSGLGITGADKSLDKIEEIGKNEMSMFLQESFGVTPEKAESRVNSVLNTVRVITGAKGGNLISKGGLKNIAKGVTVTLSPESLLAGAAVFAKEEGLDIPKSDILKSSAANIVTAFNLGPSSKKLNPPENQLGIDFNVTKESSTKSLGEPKVDLKKKAKETILDTREQEQLRREKVAEKPFMREKRGDLVFNEEYLNKPVSFTNSNGTIVQGSLVGNDYGGKIKVYGVDGKEYNLLPDRLNLIDKITQTKDDFIEPKKEKNKAVKVEPTVKAEPTVKVDLKKTSKKAQLTAQEKKARNETYKEFEQLAGLQETKSDIGLGDLVMTKEQSYSEKKRLVDSLMSKGYIIKDGVDKKGERFAFTQKAKDDFNIGGKNSGLKFVKDLVHLPQNPPTTKVGKTSLSKKASEKVKIEKTPETDVVLDTIVEKIEPTAIDPTTTAIEKVEQKPTTEIIKVEPTTGVDETGLKKQSDLVKKSKKRFSEQDIESEKAKVFRDDGGGEASSIGYEGAKEIEGYTADLNILAKRFSVAGKGKINLAKRIANKALSAGKSIKDTALSNIGSFLNSVILIDKKTGAAKGLGDYLGGVKGKITDVHKAVSEALNIPFMEKFLEKNVSKIDSAFNFLKNKDINELIPGDSTIKQIRRFFVERARDMNDLYAKTSGVKKDFANKLAFISQYLGGEIRDRMYELKKSKMEDIESKNYPEDIKQELIDQVQISKEEIDSITNDVLSILPEDSRGFFGDYFKIYGQFSDDSVLKRGFKKIAQDLVGKKIDETINPDKDYNHGYIPDEVFREYIRITGDNLGLNGTDLSVFLKEGKPLTAKQRSDILKKSNNVWYLHSQDPLSIAYSYTNKIGELIHNKRVDDILNYVSKINPEIAEYLKDLKDTDSKIYKDVLGFAKPTSYAGRFVNKFLNAAGYGLYVGNPTLAIQNTFTAGVYGAGKTFSNIVTGKGRISKEVFTKENKKATEELLFNKGFLSHKDTDKNIGISGSASLAEKVRRNTRKYLWAIPLQKSTALGVRSMQIFVANSYMSKFVNGDIKPGETLAQAYTRKTLELPIDQQLIESSRLYEQVSFIENNTELARPTNSFFDIKLFNMVTSFARQQSSYIVDKTADLVDTAHRNIREVLKTTEKVKKGNKKQDVPLAKKENVADNIIGVSTKLVLPYVLAKMMLEGIYGEDDERADEIKKKLVAESFSKYVQYFLLHSTGLAGYSIGAERLSDIANLSISIGDAIESGDEAQIKESMLKFTDKWFSGVDKLSDIVAGNEDQISKGGYFKYKDEYKNETFGDFLGRVLGVSEQSAQYNKAYTDFKKIENELMKESADYSILSTIGDYIQDKKGELGFTSDKVKVLKFKLRVDRMNRNIDALENSKIDFNTWIESVLDGITTLDSSDLRGSLSESIGKDILSNKKVIDTLKPIISEIEGVKQVKISDSDFPETLRSLKETHPKLYSDFYKRLYGAIKTPGIDESGDKATNDFIDVVIYADRQGELLGSSIASQVERIITQKSKIAGEKGLEEGVYRDLRNLNGLMEILNTTPELRDQIYSSLSEVIETSLTKDNIGLVLTATKDFPEIYNLYKRASELRGAIMKEEEIVDKEIAKTEKKDTIDSTSLGNNTGKLGTPTKSSDQSNLPKNPLILKDEKKKSKLVDLIDMKQKKSLQPKLEDLKLETLIDKI